MFLLNTTQSVLALLFLISCMLGIGTQTEVSDLRVLMTDRSFLARTLVANFLIVPLVGLVIVKLLPLPPPIAGALLLLACTPGGMSAIQFTSKVKDDTAMAGAVFCLLSALALVISPVLLNLVLPENVRVVVPFGAALLFFVIYLLLPLLAGMLLLAKVPSAAAKLSKPLSLIAAVTFVAFLVMTSGGRKAATGEIGMAAVGAMLLFILVSILIGWFMGGPTNNSRQILASSTSMRNAAFCLAIVQASAPDHAVLTPLIAFSLLMVPPNTLFTIFSTVQAKRKAKQAVANG